MLQKTTNLNSRTVLSDEITTARAENSLQEIAEGANRAFKSVIAVDRAQDISRY